MANLVQIIKQAAMDAYRASNPADLRFGTVSSIAPLKITVTPQFILNEKLLIVPEHLKDRSIDIGLVRSNGAERAYQVHLYTGLQINDRVALLRAQGGQRYFILGRIYGDGTQLPEELR